MPRPSRCRRICTEPEFDRFVPCGISGAGRIVLTVDEYEVIRLIDFEKKTHEQCARQMDVSRTTVTEIYERARFKLADYLINGKTLYIAGGNYRLCDGAAEQCCKSACRRAADTAANTRKKGAKELRIAVTYDNEAVFQHFGHTKQFKLYDVEGQAVTHTQIVEASEGGHGALAGFLLNHQVDTLICGGIGGGAQSALAEAGIRLFGGVAGQADEAVKALLAGELRYNPDVHCTHHEHEHSCGSHACGEDKHGCSGN